MLGKAIKQLRLPRDEIVIMTKVSIPPLRFSVVRTDKT
jgi:aryl-alcohol dehydrogenase-like predicted oxidoreductase